MAQTTDSGVNVKQTILEVMREMLRTNKFVERSNLFSILQTKMDRTTFDQELEKMQSDGLISQAYDVNTFCLVE